MKKYPFAISVLYQTLRIVLLNCRNNLTAFADFKGRYTAEYIATLLAELEVAQNMKAEQARSLEHESLRIELLPVASNCRKHWQYLKRYIADAFGRELEVANWDAAGWEYYEESVSNWDKLREMCSMALLYIEDNKDALMRDNNMPESFKDVYAEVCASFNEKYNAFLLAQENARQGTEQKIEANNAIYEKVVKICLDGQAIFMEDDVKKNFFSMQAVSELIKPLGASGLKGTVTKNGKAQVGLIVELENSSKRVITDAEGAFDFGNQLASGKETIIIKRGDEVLAEEDVVLPVGVTKRENVVLAAAQVPTDIIS